MKRAALLCLTLLVGGCVYYNGMYNTKRLAGGARKAEAEGRTFDAASLWGQVEVKAESVLARHPNSKWAEEARLLQGTALVKLRNCAGALPPLENVMVTARNATMAEEAAVLVGGCRATLGDPVGAMSAYSRLTSSRDTARRSLALFAHGRAQRMNGEYEAALAELAGTDYPGTRGERAAALAGLGRLPEALAIADTLLTARDTLTPWDSLLAALGRHDPETASALTDRIAESSRVPATIRASVLVADAARWRETDPDRSERRLAAAVATAGGTPGASEAKFEALRSQIRLADSPPVLLEQATRLEELGEDAGSVAPRAAQLAGFARMVAIASDSVPPGSPQGDMRLFVAGEMARDSLVADRFAARQFRRVLAEWPASPFAPKAILALILLEPDQADSLRATLLAGYPSSPYVAMIEGGASPEYAVLEDSLRRFAISFRPEARRAPVQIRQVPPPPAAAPREPVNR
jgi:hypothetical protein